MRIGLIGVGFWGTNILNTLIKLKLKNKITVYDVDYKNIKIAQKRYGNNIICFKNEKIFLQQKIDFFIIATSVSTHFHYLKKLSFLKDINKKKIFVEKPATLNFKELKLINKYYGKNAKNIFIGYVYLYNNYITKIKKIIDKKVLGNIQHVIFERLNFGPVRSDVSSIKDLSSHDLAISTYLFRTSRFFKCSKILINKNNKKNYDLNYILLKNKKFNIEIRSGWLYPEKIRKIIIIGSKKILYFDEMKKTGKLSLHEKTINYFNIDKFPKKFFTQNHNVYNGKITNIKVKDVSPLQNELIYFLKGKKGLSDIDFAIEIHKIIDKSEQS